MFRRKFSLLSDLRRLYDWGLACIGRVYVSYNDKHILYIE
jgi:hypothetical protein